MTELEARKAYLDELMPHQPFCLMHFEHAAVRALVSSPRCTCDEVRDETARTLAEDPNVMINIPKQTVIDLGRRITVLLDESEEQATDHDPLTGALDTDETGWDGRPGDDDPAEPSHPANVPGSLIDSPGSERPGDHQ